MTESLIKKEKILKHRKLSAFLPKVNAQNEAQPNLKVRGKESLTVEGKKFKDFNANGQLDSYEDWVIFRETPNTEIITNYDQSASRNCRK